MRSRTSGTDQQHSSSPRPSMIQLNCSRTIYFFVCVTYGLTQDDYGEFLALCVLFFGIFHDMSVLPNGGPDHGIRVEGTCSGSGILRTIPDVPVSHGCWVRGAPRSDGRVYQRCPICLFIRMVHGCHAGQHVWLRSVRIQPKEGCHEGRSILL